MKKALLIIGGVIIFIIAFSAGNGSKNSQSVTPTMETKEKFKPLSYTGTNNIATEKFALPKGLKTFKMSHQGISNFSVWLLDKDGKKVELVVNELGDFEGTKAIEIKNDGQYLMDVDADGPWTIKIE